MVARVLRSRSSTADREGGANAEEAAARSHEWGPPLVDLRCCDRFRPRYPVTEPFAVDPLPMWGQWCAVVEPEPELELELGFGVAADVLAASAWLTPNAPAVTLSLIHI